MKVAIITANPLALPVFFTSQTRFLVQQGIEIVTISAPCEELREFGRQTQCEVVEIEMTRRISPLADLKSLWRLWNELRSIRPNLVHAHMPKGGLLGLTAAVLAGVPLRYFTVHGLRSANESGLKMQIVRLGEAITFRFATHVFAVSSSLRRSLMDAGICSGQKVKVLGKGACSGVDTGYFDPASRSQDRDSVRLAHAIPTSAFLLGYAGRICKAKGIEDLCDAWRNLRAENENLWLLLCGPVDQEDPASSAILQELSADARVRMTGELVRDMPAIFSAVDLCVVPSHREGLGVVALEAGAMEKAVVAYNTGGLADAVVDGKTGILVPLGDREALTRSIRELIGNEPKRVAMGCAGRTFVQTSFEANGISRLLLQEYLHPGNGESFVGAMAMRMFDLCVAALMTILTLPLLALAMLSIRVALGSPVLFRQQRAGKDGRPFRLWKLRTMTDARDAAGNLLPDDQRLPAIGKFLRASSIDELPQLWNVLCGDMSLVGPRPLLVNYLSRYSAFESRRHEVLPGITGWAQVHGRNGLSWQSTFAMDVWYVDNRSWRLNAEILWATALRVLHLTSVHQAETKGRSEFLGGQTISLSEE